MDCDYTIYYRLRGSHGDWYSYFKRPHSLEFCKRRLSSLTGSIFMCPSSPIVVRLDSWRGLVVYQS